MLQFALATPTFSIRGHSKIWLSILRFITKFRKTWISKRFPSIFFPTCIIYLLWELQCVTRLAFCHWQKRSNVSVTQAPTELLSSSVCLGADCLMKLLGNYCRNLDIKTAITVGVVGKRHDAFTCSMVSLTPISALCTLAVVTFFLQMALCSVENIIYLYAKRNVHSSVYCHKHKYSLGLLHKHDWTGQWMKN